MQKPASISYSNASGSLKIMMPYGEDIPLEIKDLLSGLTQSVTYLKSQADTIDWAGKQYVIQLSVRTYISELLGKVYMEYCPNPNNFTHLPKGAKEKLGNLTLIGKQSDLKEIKDIVVIREVLSQGFYIVPSTPQRPQIKINER